ncbi:MULTISPECIES: AAA family ATPase [unclassified Acetobacterium]|jgi:hypothetical protein|uniref:AAA family ATPase n=1 Tax=unclassified Acetobacterium TaxID=2638182 RepID=UPI000DBEB00E|nr:MULTISPECIES: ATP-binding protein [unclassified Acetobacterium]AWW28441.1 ATP-binding protein [Acetobacterium sp. KB-1]MDZ5726796.1 ATP-binding protein [Acetobacterium sp. K1/6]
MKILKIKANGLKLFSDNLDIDFTTLQRVRNEKNEMLHQISSKIYQNNVLAFIGVNASGKTSTLKLISFVIQMIDNEPINKIKCNDILEGISVDDRVDFEVYFSIKSDKLYKLHTTIKKDYIDNKAIEKYTIENENIWMKHINTIITKKSIFDFSDIEPMLVRKGDEEYLPNDISIVISLNKKNNTKIFFNDLVDWTNINLIRVIGDFPQELITFLDSSIEYLRFNVDDLNDAQIDLKEIKLKFKGKKELILYSPLELEKYLSSGTIKGLNVFMSAISSLQEGGYLIVDELENHFNKEIVATLIRLFMNKKINKKGAVLLFSTHYPELLDEFERNDNIYIIKNDHGINVQNLSKLLKRSDLKKSEVYESGYLEGTVPSYESYMAFEKVLCDLKLKEDV